MGSCMFGEMITIFFSILIVILGIFVVTNYQAWFKKHRLKLLSLFMVFGIIVYAIGYLTQYPDDYIYSGLMAIFSTGRMFVLENDIASFEFNVEKNPYYRLTFSLIMTFSMLIIGMVALSFMGYRVLSEIQLGFMRLIVRKRKIYIFTHLNEKALTLARDLKKNQPRRIIIFCIDDNDENDDKKNLEKKAAELKCLVIATDHLIVAKEWTASSQINRSGALIPVAIFKLCRRLKNNQIIILAMNDDDDANVIFAADFATLWQAEKGVISLYVFVKRHATINYFDRLDFSGLDIHIIDENDLACRQLFSDFTLMSCIGEHDSLRVGVVGYTDISENLYKNIAFLGQCQGKKLEIILIDEGIADKTAMFFNRNSEIEKCAQFTLVDLKINSREFFQYFRDQIETIDCIIFADAWIEMALEINRISREAGQCTPLCIDLENDVQSILLLKTGCIKVMIAFGSISRIYTERIIIDEKLDELAKGFHRYYADLFEDKRAWDDISLFEKNSNRALALHVQSKLYTLGLKYVNGGNSDYYDQKIQDQQILEKLAIGEHLRWNAFSFANGWKTMTNIESYPKNKDVVNQTHACLVDWEQLERVSQHFLKNPAEKNYQEMDRHLIRNIGAILKSAGFGIVKIEKCEGVKR